MTFIGGGQSNETKGRWWASISAADENFFSMAEKLITTPALVHSCCAMFQAGRQKHKTCH